LDTLKQTSHLAFPVLNREGCFLSIALGDVHLKLFSKIRYIRWRHSSVATYFSSSL
jgi:hypothetical protein